MSFSNLLWVGMGGFVGSALRYLISAAVIALRLDTPLPIATLTVNIVGSFIIGLLLAILDSNSLYYLLVVGLCGGFTTFSTFSADTLALLRTGHYSWAIGYIMLSVVLCLAAVWVGTLIGTRMHFIK